MKEYQRQSIEWAVSNVNKSIFLPDIQRPFVWEVDQIYRLFDSLMREYPISTFLFWNLSRESLEVVEHRDNTKVKMYRFVESNEQESAEEINRERDSYYLVLDGQQRLTSLYIALRGSWRYEYRRKHVVEELHFNALSGPEENQDGIQYEFAFRKQQQGMAAIESADGEPRKLWVNIKRVFDQNLGQARRRKELVRSLSETHALTPAEQNAVDDNIEQFNDVTKQNPVINFFPEQENRYERVLDIFVRTNSGGTKLSYSDLLFSKIQSAWGAARDRFHKLTEDLSRNDFEFDNDFVLKCCLVFYGKTSDDVKFSVANLRDDLIHAVTSEWDSRIVPALSATVDFLMRDVHIGSKKGLPSANALIPIAYWSFKSGRLFNGETEHDAKERTAMRQWLLQALLSGVFSGMSDTVLYRAKEGIDHVNAATFPAEAITTSIHTLRNRRMDLGAVDLDSITYGTRASHLVLLLAYAGDVAFRPACARNLPDQDHVISRKELLDAGMEKSRIDCIFNLRYVAEMENKRKGDTPYKEWRQSLGANAEAVLGRHFIPDGDWTAATYGDFLQARRELLMRRLGMDGRNG